MGSSSKNTSEGQPYRLLLACRDGLSRSQVFVDFSASHDRKPHPDPRLEESVEEVWKQRISVNPSLFNALKFRYGGYVTSSTTTREEFIEATTICLCLGLTDY
ncbi:hypothetical protein KI387_006585, partial [Taxus chinensis]